MDEMQRLSLSKEARLATIVRARIDYRAKGDEAFGKEAANNGPQQRLANYAQ